MTLQEAVNSEIAFKISEYMESNCLTEDGLKDISRLTSDELNMIENQRTISSDTLSMICDFLDITVDSLCRPPKSEPEYRKFVSEIWDIIISHHSRSYKRSAIREIQKSSPLDRKQWNRYLIWLEYEISEQSVGQSKTKKIDKFGRILSEIRGKFVEKWPAVSMTPGLVEPENPTGIRRAEETVKAHQPKKKK